MIYLATVRKRKNTVQREGNEGRGKTQHERDMAEQQVGCAAIFQPSIYGREPSWPGLLKILQLIWTNQGSQQL
jgi:hypothetical protein